MTSKIVVNNIEADTGISTITFTNEVTAPTFNGNIVGTAATFSGNVDIAGALTYEDVTNVDSVGIITAQAGIHVTGGSVGIGTNNPAEALEVYGDARFKAPDGSHGIELFSDIGSLGYQRIISWNRTTSVYENLSIGANDLIIGPNFERLRITSAGKVGIGLTNPEVLLHLQESNADPFNTIITHLKLNNAGGNGGSGSRIELKTGAARCWIQSFIDGGNSNSGGALIFGTPSSGGLGTERLRINSAGSVGIGTDNPGQSLDVVGKINVQDSSDARLLLKVAGTNVGALQASAGAITLYGASSSNVIKLQTGGQERLRVSTGGDVGIGTDNPGTKLDVFGGVRSNNDSENFQVYASNGFTRGTLQVSPGGNGLDLKSTFNNSGYISASTISGGALYERLRITSDGKFGFNTTNPGAFDSGANHFVILGNTSGTGNAGITIASGTDSYGNIYFADGTSGADAYRGHIAYNHNGNSMRFATNGTERLRITPNVGPWAEGNKGPTQGTLHLNPDSTAHMGGAITFGASDDSSNGSSAMAGIYTRSDGTYGTKMYLATTDSYATGPKNFLEADNYGHIRTPRQPFIYGIPTNTSGSGVFNSFGGTQTRGGLAFTTDRITVSREGVYLITFNTICDSSVGRENAYIKINGSNIVNTLSEDNGDGYHYRGASICYYLNANDYIQVENDDWYSASSNSTEWKTMSVALLG